MHDVATSEVFTGHGETTVTVYDAPEPSTLARAGLGGLGLIGAIRRRR